jgi:hypothetical protein
VPASVSGDDWKTFREDVDDLALALVSPLRANDDRSFTLFHNLLRYAKVCRFPGSHTRFAAGLRRPDK